MIFKSVISNVNTFRIEKVIRGPVIISRGGRILRDHTVFQVLKDQVLKERGEGGGISRRQQSLKKGL